MCSEPEILPYPSGDTLHLLHVIPADATSLPVPPAFLGNSGYSPCVISPGQMEDALAEHAELFITQCLVGLAYACSAKCTVEIVRPSRGGCDRASGGAGGGTLPRRINVGEAICQAADSLGAAVVVIPGHRRMSFFERLFQPDDHASYASYVAKNSKRPTLIFQPPDSEAHSSSDGNNGMGSVEDVTTASRGGYTHETVAGLLQQ